MQQARQIHQVLSCLFETPGSPYSHNCPGTREIDQAGLLHRDLPTCASAGICPAFISIFNTSKSRYSRHFVTM